MTEYASKYYLAVNYGHEGWQLKPVSDRREAVALILSGETHGYEFKVLKDLRLEVVEEP